MANNRDDFSSKTVEILRKRVGLLCSNPVCGRSTSGPHADPEKATIVGVAAHITAASAGGPRYDAALSEKDRKSASNGIWLCVNCSTIIDKNPNDYSVALLQEWKSKAEKSTNDRLKGIGESAREEEKLAHIDLDLIWTGSRRANRGLSAKNLEIFGNAPIQAGSPVIIHWHLTWFYSFVIFNNSPFHAYNLQIVPRQPDLELPKLAAKNNLPALGSIELEATFTRGFEGSHLDADELLKPIFPPDLIGSRYDVHFTDDSRVAKVKSFVLTEGGFIEA